METKNGKRKGSSKPLTGQEIACEGMMKNDLTAFATDFQRGLFLLDQDQAASLFHRALRLNSYLFVAQNNLRVLQYRQEMRAQGKSPVIENAGGDHFAIILGILRYRRDE